MKFDHLTYDECSIAPVLQMYLESKYEYSDIHRVQNRSDQWVKIFLILVKISQKKMIPRGIIPIIKSVSTFQLNM